MDRLEIELCSKLDAILARLCRIENMLQVIQKEEITEMADLTKLTADITAMTTVDSSILALVSGMAAEIAALPPDQASIDALAATVEQQTAALQAAVVANTPAAPPAS